MRAPASVSVHRLRAGRSVRLFGAALAAAIGMLLLPLRTDAATPPDRIWFCPGPGTLDYLRLFENPNQWTHARQAMSVFKFYQQHTQMPPDRIVGPNTYDALVRVDAFRTLTQWGKKIGIEVAAVKDYYCTPDASGMTAAINATAASVRAVQTAGGTVSYLAMDEPFVSGRGRVCGGPALEPTADRVGTYVSGVRAAFPDVKIGLIEAYPFSSADALVAVLQLLKERNATPAFLHMDVDWHLAGSPAFLRDMARLKNVSATAGIPFGIIVTGYNGDADSLYAVDAYGITELIAQTFSSWDSMPDHLIVQSWAVSSSGLLVTPSNLPEDVRYTHTNMLFDVYRRLRGASGPARGGAVRKH
ncbi:MAG TPA: hypothetical protein VGF24_00015 [Vicinamibacterales bacterium]